MVTSWDESTSLTILKLKHLILLSMWSNLFLARDVFLVFVLRSTPHHMSLVQ